jgi:hypothetical protein
LSIYRREVAGKVLPFYDKYQYEEGIKMVDEALSDEVTSEGLLSWLMKFRLSF